jgi:hypothetical protein
MTKQRKIVLCALLLAGLMCGCERGGRSTYEDQERTVVDLGGKWKFELGDDSLRARADENDGAWDNIRVPAAWEDAGFPGYDGYAWYRRHFMISKVQAGKRLFFTSGPIDDVDAVYVNGHFIGSSGAFPPAFSTAYNMDRRYRLASRYLNPGGDNVIAVRVYDDGGAGGFLWGKVRIVETKYGLEPAYDLSDGWKIRMGDDMAWKDPSYDDTGWEPISVPGNWESQGYPDYDGYAWYRVTFTPPRALEEENLVMVVGRIDDFDEVYLNGTLIGKTGDMRGEPGLSDLHDEYRQLRAYMLEPGVLKPGEQNVLAVRVYDGFRDGGIYEGPVGLVRRSEYRRFLKHTGELDWIKKFFE